MKKIFLKSFALLFFILVILFPIKAKAATFDNITEIYNSKYVVPYGKEIGIKHYDDEIITSDNENICKIISSEKMQIVGVGNFTLTYKKGDETTKIKFFAWNAYLKEGQYYVFSDEDRTSTSGNISAKMYLAVSEAEDTDSFKIEDYFKTTGSYTGSDLKGKYISSYYDEENCESTSRNFEYSFVDNFPDDEDDDTSGSDDGNRDSDTPTSTAINLKLGDTYTPQTSETLTWNIENEDILKFVDRSKGIVRATRVGATKLIGKTSNGTKKVELTINVYNDQRDPIVVTKITLDKTEIKLDVNKTAKITATVEPEYATNKRITWSSSNPAIASVSTFGKVMGKSVGVATITATAPNGVSAKCTVIVGDIDKEQTRTT